jgi:hypothetical protein
MPNTIADRERKFQDALNPLLPTAKHISPCYGTSNIARMVPNGVVLAVSNLKEKENALSGVALCLLSRLCPLPNVELYLAGVIYSEIDKLTDRLKQMLQAYADGDTGTYSEFNNNTSFCLGKSGLVYAYSKKISEIDDPPPDHLGKGIPLDSLYYSVYCPNATREEVLVLKSVLTSLGHLVGHDRLIEVPTWGHFGLAPIGQGKASFDGLVSNMKTTFAQAGLLVTDGLPARFLSSLITKRFVILTGLSGSGKTKIAYALANYMALDGARQCCLVSVGADWTSNENILGYQDALSTDRYRKPTSGVLDLILVAEKDQANPYFLILDEMNLSHVERYFADILSAIESKQTIALHSSDKDLPAFDNDPYPVPSRLKLPPNLFIIGTVNVDETTYMFSPKVLDRANVIEFRVAKDGMTDFLGAPKAVDMESLAAGGAAFSEAFVAATNSNDISAGAIPEAIRGTADVAKDLNDSLLSVFEGLAEIGAEFGYRTAYEISRFVYFHAVLSGKDWQFKDALDAQVFQKLLPKLHGSERRLGPVLEKLEKFCTERQLDLSLEKIKRMRERLKDGFTSFAEA